MFSHDETRVMGLGKSKCPRHITWGHETQTLAPSVSGKEGRLDARYTAVFGIGALDPAHIKKRELSSMSCQGSIKELWTDVKITTVIICREGFLKLCKYPVSP
jgi:hypothetical protein